LPGEARQREDGPKLEKSKDHDPVPIARGNAEPHLLLVMAGRVQAIHVFLIADGRKTWITGTSPVMTGGSPLGAGCIASGERQGRGDENRALIPYGTLCPAAVNRRYHSSRLSRTSEPATDSATRPGLVVPSTT
jgi:hypothetical protein